MNYITIPSLELFYSPSGPMARLSGYEFRPQQVELASAVRDFLEKPEERFFAAEAPPGVGKTFAVLVPALTALGRDGRILFLTATIALQEQLIDKDLPRLRELLKEDFSFGLLKGRSHYACRRRALSISSPGGELLLPGFGGPTPDVAGWLEETETGDMSELGLPVGHPLLGHLAAGTRGCLGTACPFRERCFVQQTYRNAQNWRIVVANYHLYFSHILEGGGAFPVRCDWLICDEAHRMPDAARNAAALRADLDEGLSLLRRGAWQAFDPLFRSQSVDMGSVQGSADNCASLLKELFEAAGTVLTGEGVTTRDEALLQRGAAVADALNSLRRMFRSVEDCYMSGGFVDRALLARAAEMMNWLDGLRDFRNHLLWCLEVENFPRWAYWGDGRGLQSAPVQCSDIISDVLAKEDPQKAIFISATLTLEGDFSFWSRETGVLPDRTLKVGSPFDFARQMEIVVVDVALNVRDPGYDERMCRVMEKLCDENGGRTLVLLSSMRLLSAFVRVMRRRDRPYAVLAQGDMPQRALLEHFRSDKASTLIGSVSFREGVDVPGDGLTQVIIDRIPFPHPRDPLVQARNELEGDKAFVVSTLPTARLFLRQAVGRLIRSSSDRGRVFLLDGRALTRKSWKILADLPECPRRRLVVSLRGSAPEKS
ncbi:MAG: ATP-dependent DNA helicase [Fretibacterium sp.]|nr:ATP-dependent DNA helicase [Fretibacterium sp.]